LIVVTQCNSPVYSLAQTAQKRFNNSSPTGSSRHISSRDSIGLLLLAYRQERQIIPERAGNDGYDNGRLSGVLDEVLPLLLDDHSGRQYVANAKMLSGTLETFLCARH
jgi:hypothetical protein